MVSQPVSVFEKPMSLFKKMFTFSPGTQFQRYDYGKGGLLSIANSTKAYIMQSI
jgi:hypothetical protein